jgi:hypothetical protein
MTTTNKFERLGRLVTDISELEARVRSMAQEEFKPALTEAASILKEYVPNVKAFRWAQWIPGFNDGDACEFTMGDVSFAFRDNGNVESDSDDGFYDPYYFDDLKAKGLLSEEQEKVLDELAEAIVSLEGAAELAFGPDVQVTLDLDTMELEIEHYDCGY